MKYLMPIFVLVTSIFAYATSKPIRVLNDIKQVKDSIEFTPQIIDPDLEYKIYYQAAEYIIKDNPDSIICLSDSIENLNLWPFAGAANEEYMDFLLKAQLIHISAAWPFHTPIFVNALAKIKKQLNVNNHNEKRCTDILVFSDIYYNTLCGILNPPDGLSGMFGGRLTKKFYFFVFSDEGDLIDAHGGELIID